LTAAQVGAGLPAPSAAAALLGTSGGILMLVLLFLAVTSAASAELVAVSSLITYDVYVPYVNPNATERQILAVDHIAIVVYGVIMGVLGVIFFYAGISMGWLYEFMGVVLGSAVCPIALSIMSGKANKRGCIAGAWIGLAAGIIAWLVTTATLNGNVISIDTTFQDYPMLAGNLASLGVGGIISTATSLMWPENFDFDITRALHVHGDGSDHGGVVVDGTGMSLSPSSQDDKDMKSSSAEDPEKAAAAAAPAALPKEKSSSTTASESSVHEEVYDENKDPVKLAQAFKLAVYTSLFLFVVLILLVSLFTGALSLSLFLFLFLSPLSVFTTLKLTKSDFFYLFNHHRSHYLFSSVVTSSLKEDSRCG
jgi:hypothetical protein